MEIREIIDISTGQIIGSAPWNNVKEIEEMVDVAFDAQT